MNSYIHYVRSINFFQLILQCHNIHTIDFNDIYNLVGTCVTYVVVVSSLARNPADPGTGTRHSGEQFQLVAYEG